MNHDRTAIERPCPACGAPVELSAADLVVGKLVRCLHCNAEAQVGQEWDARLGAHHWTLEESGDELPPERV